MADLILSEKDRRRFEKFLVPEPGTGCLLWLGARIRQGYGIFKLRGRAVKAHRVAFVMGGGILTPERPLVLHKCPAGANTACCEYAHLAAGTDAENMLDMVRDGHAGRKAKWSETSPWPGRRSGATVPRRQPCGRRWRIFAVRGDCRRHTD